MFGWLTALSVFVCAMLLVCIDRPADAQVKRPQIGVYYFPGWLASDWAPKGAWEPIRSYPDRKPLLGWYDQSSPAVMKRQLQWMHAYGIDYVVMDWYYEQGDVRLDEGLKAYLSLPDPRIALSLLWANHGEVTTPVIFRNIVTIWIDRYLYRPTYFRKDGKPVIFIFSYEKLTADAKASGSSVGAYVAMAQTMARKAGLPGLFLVAGTDDFSPHLVNAGPKAAGFDAVSAYQLHRKPQIEEKNDPQWGRPTHGWTELSNAYAKQWAAGSSLSLPMVVPMISGLDRRPWGGFTPDPKHDLSISGDLAFRRHLTAAKKIMARSAGGNPGMGVICCWNEFGEGAFIEPTVGQGLSRLKAIRDTFGASARSGVAPVASASSRKSAR